MGTDSGVNRAAIVAPRDGGATAPLATLRHHPKPEDETMAKRAICVGINKFKKYPQFALNGCVNDAKDMAALCKSLLGFKASEVTTLLDARATKAAIMSKLKAAVADARAGKLSAILFSLSSHGTQMTDASGDEP